MADINRAGLSPTKPEPPVSHGLTTLNNLLGQLRDEVFALRADLDFILTPKQDAPTDSDPGLTGEFPVSPVVGVIAGLCEDVRFVTGIVADMRLRSEV